MAIRSDIVTAGFTLTVGSPESRAVCTATPAARPGLDPEPTQWPVLVTGAGGFVGGHIARYLAASGHSVKGLSRRPPLVQAGDPVIDWVIGDLADPDVMRRALSEVRGVIHAAGWVSLGPDRLGTSHAVNVDLTRRLLSEAAAAGVERFVYTSTLYTLAAGTESDPADEFTRWNLERVDSPYTRTKREAERMVLEASCGRFSTVALCPGMVHGPRDSKPTSTRIAKAYSRSRIAFAPPGGIPIVDCRTLASAHRRALIVGGDGKRYAVVGPYLSYGELATIVASIAGRPRHLICISDRLEPVVTTAAAGFGPLVRWWWPDVSSELAAGGFLRLHVRGDRANACFNLSHPPAIESIARSL
jgi:dihydroflavonol-4-reductase